MPNFARVVVKIYFRSNLWLRKARLVDSFAESLVCTIAALSLKSLNYFGNLDIGSGELDFITRIVSTRTTNNAA